MAELKSTKYFSPKLYVASDVLYVLSSKAPVSTKYPMEREREGPTVSPICNTFITSDNGPNACKR